MLTIAEAAPRIELFLTVQMLETLKAVKYELPSFEFEHRIPATTCRHRISGNPVLGSGRLYAHPKST
jgi:hypothetical protein